MTEKRIYKYDFTNNNTLPGGILKLSMPKDAQILSLQLQGDKFVLWAIVDVNSNQSEPQLNGN